MGAGGGAGQSGRAGERGACTQHPPATTTIHHHHQPPVTTSAYFASRQHQLHPLQTPVFFVAFAICFLP
jgi:hypothetical protein